MTEKLGENSSPLALASKRTLVPFGEPRQEKDRDRNQNHESAKTGQ